MKPFRSSLCIVRLLPIAASLLFVHSLAAADARPQAVQEALKKRGFYFGEINGVVDDQTKAALKRFQIREGLTVTGQIDAPTVAALQKKRAASGDDSPQNTSARERAQNIVQSDQEFLDKVQAIEGGPPAAPSNLRIVTDPTPPPLVAPTPPPQTITNEPLAPVAEPPASISQSTFPVTAPTPETGVERVRPPAKATTEGKVKSKKPVASERAPLAPVAERIPSTSRDGLPPASNGSKEGTSYAPPGISEAEARQFVNDYLKAAEGPTPATEVTFYGDQVDYFDSGRVSRTFIEKDQRNYYRRWPVRNFDLVSPPQINRLSGSDATMRFKIRYSLGGGKQTAKGLTENVLRVRNAGTGLKIVAIRERKIRE